MKPSELLDQDLDHNRDPDQHLDRDADRTIEELDRAIVSLSARINASTHDLLMLVRRFDERCGWLKWGFESCAEWLHWRCDLSLSAAREKVRVAHALKTLPLIGAAFAAGRLSYSKVRALTRVAGRHNEEELLTFALRVTAATLEAKCQELRFGSEASLEEAGRAWARRALRMQHEPARNRMLLTVELPLEQGELIDKALDKARDSARDAPLSRPSWRRAGRSSRRMRWWRWRALTCLASRRAVLGPTITR